jgi:hypothetical protein
MESHGKYKLWILEMAFTARTVEKLYVRNGLIAWKSFNGKLNLLVEAKHYK